MMKSKIQVTLTPSEKHLYFCFIRKRCSSNNSQRQVKSNKVMLAVSSLAVPAPIPKALKSTTLLYCLTW